jgi:hypothetical protein
MQVSNRYPLHSKRSRTRFRRGRDEILGVAVVVAATVGVLMAPTAGQAAGTARLGPPTSHQQCVIAQSGTQRCFATAAEAIAYGSGGRIAVARDATTHDALIALRAHDAESARGLAAPKRARAAALVSNIIGIEYDGSNRSGAAKYFSVSGDCYSGATFGFPKLSVYGWNDRINSAQTFVGCVGQHYDDTYYSDTMVSVFGTKDDFGGQNNKTSSIKFV